MMSARPLPDLGALRIHREPPRASHAGRWTAIALIATAAIAAAWWFAPRRATTPIATVARTPPRAATPSAAGVLSATGYLVADREAKITPKISGRVVRLDAEEGREVRRGDVLAVLESTNLHAQREEVTAALWQARRDYDRQSALWDERITSRAALDAATAQLLAAEARVKEVDVDIRDMIIRAPFDGTIVTKNTEVGEVISSSTLGQVGGTLPAGAICTLVDLDTLKVVADVNETSLAGLHVGETATISVDAFPGRTWSGDLAQIIPTADRAKGIVQVKVAIAGSLRGLLPEMSATVTFR